MLVVAKSTLLASALGIFAVWMSGMRDYSRGVILLYGVLAFGFMAGIRISLRYFWQTLAPAPARRRAAIVGAGNTAEIVMLVLRSYEDLQANAVLILDTDPARDSTRVYGIPVRYSGTELARTLRQHRIDLVIVGAAPATPEEREIAETCLQLTIPVFRFEVTVTPFQYVPAAALASVPN